MSLFQRLDGQELYPSGPQPPVVFLTSPMPPRMSPESAQRAAAWGSKQSPLCCAKQATTDLKYTIAAMMLRPKLRSWPSLSKASTSAGQASCSTTATRSCCTYRTVRCPMVPRRSSCVFLSTQKKNWAASACSSGSTRTRATGRYSYAPSCTLASRCLLRT